MRQLRDDTHLILDGEVRVYRREGDIGKHHFPYLCGGQIYSYLKGAEPSAQKIC